MLAIGYSDTTAWVFPAIIDTAVAVSTLMLVALGDKLVRRTWHRDHSPPINKRIKWPSHGGNGKSRGHTACA